MKRIFFVADFDARDVSKYSGTAYFMAKSLECETMRVERIGPLKEHWSYYFKLKQLAYKGLIGTRHLRDREPAILRSYAKQIEDILKRSDSDLVFCPGTVAISYLECKQPIVFWTDATFAGMLNYYPSFSNLNAQSVFNGNQMEQSALSRASIAIYSSDWAAKTAAANYRVDAEKLKVVPFGANIKRWPSRDWVAEQVKMRRSRTCKLIFLGVEWHRKGGDIAFNVAKELNAQGLHTVLSVIGCEPPVKKPYPRFLEVVGFVNKNTEDGMGRIMSYLAQSHFLMLPARADASPHVCCEASASGVPSLVTNTGGIPIEDHVNGRVMAKDASVADYCEAIVSYFENTEVYESLAMSSYDQFARKLNWETSAKAVRDLVAELT